MYMCIWVNSGNQTTGNLWIKLFLGLHMTRMCLQQLSLTFANLNKGGMVKVSTKGLLITLQPFCLEFCMEHVCWKMKWVNKLFPWKKAYFFYIALFVGLLLDYIWGKWPLIALWESSTVSPLLVIVRNKLKNSLK